MSLRTLYLTPEQVEEISRPFGAAEAKVAMLAGFAEVMSNAGLLLSEADELMRKMADEKLGGWGEALASTAGNLGFWLPLGAGALGGAWTAHARHDLERNFNDKSSPEIQTLKKKIETYRTMSEDLKRTNRIEEKDAVPIAD